MGAFIIMVEKFSFVKYPLERPRRWQNIFHMQCRISALDRRKGTGCYTILTCYSYRRSVTDKTCTQRKACSAVLFVAIVRCTALSWPLSKYLDVCLLFYSRLSCCVASKNCLTVSRSVAHYSVKWYGRWTAEGVEGSGRHSFRSTADRTHQTLRWTTLSPTTVVWTRDLQNAKHRRKPLYRRPWCLVRFEVLAGVLPRFPVFWNVILCLWVSYCTTFRRILVPHVGG